MRGKVFLASLSMVSYLIQPYAQAQQQANWSAQVLKEFVKSTKDGSGKNLTIDKFWNQNYLYLPAEMQRAFKPAVEVQKNDTLPKMEVINIKGPQGVETSRLMINVNGKTISIELLGGRDKFARINGVMVSQADVMSVEGLMKKMSQDAVFQSETKRLEDRVMRKDVTPTYAEYKRMSPEQRAMMLIKLRQVSEAADVVVQMSLKQKNKKTSQNLFTEGLLNRAEAQTLADIKAARGKPCLVAGYVGEVVTKGTRTFCNPEEAIARFEAKTGIKSTCSKGSHGCNPISFPASSSVCYKPTDGDYQEFTSKCGAASPISTKEQQAALVKAYIKQKDGKDLAFGLKDGKVDNEEEYNKFIKPYMDEHNALNAEAYGKVCNDSNFAIVSKIDRKGLKSACETLKDRKLSLELFKAETGGGVPPVVGNPGTGTPAAPAEGGECHTNPETPRLAAAAGDAVPKPDGKYVKEGDKLKCVPAVVPPPAGGNTPETPETCKAKGMDFGSEDGKTVCRARSEATGGIAGGSASGSSSSFWKDNKSWLIFAGIIGVLVLSFRSMFKVGTISGPTPAQPPYPSPQPPPPAGPVTTPVTPIEGGTVPSAPPAGGNR